MAFARSCIHRSPETVLCGGNSFRSALLHSCKRRQHAHISLWQSYYAAYRCQRYSTCSELPSCFRQQCRQARSLLPQRYRSLFRHCSSFLRQHWSCFDLQCRPRTCQLTQSHRYSSWKYNQKNSLQYRPRHFHFQARSKFLH